jgi:hypothetical protein
VRAGARRPHRRAAAVLVLPDRPRLDDRERPLRALAGRGPVRRHRRLPGRFDVVSIDTEGTSIELLQTLRGHLLWGGFGLLVVEFADGEQEYEIHDICGVDEWAVCERTSNNVVLERIQWFDVTPLGAPERTEINAAGETRTRPFEATDGAP